MNLKDTINNVQTIVDQFYGGKTREAIEAYTKEVENIIYFLTAFLEWFGANVEDGQDELASAFSSVKMLAEATNRGDVIGVMDNLYIETLPLLKLYDEIGGN